MRRKSFLMVSVVLAATLVPSISKAEVPTCFGQPATIVGDGRSNRLTGTEGPDVIVGLGGSDGIDGLGGDDLICGNSGYDSLVGGDGNDQVRGGRAGDDFGTPSDASDNGDDYLVGGLGADGFHVSSGEDEIIGGKSRDDYLKGPDGVGPMLLNLTTGESLARGRLGRPRVSYGIDNIAGVEDLVGTPFHGDVLIGNGLNNRLWGYQGADRLIGKGRNDRARGEGNDVFFGGAGNDRFQTYEGNETMYGGPGTDTASYWQADHNLVGVTANLRKGIARGHGRDILSGVENLIGTYYDDTLIGNARANVLRGGPGHLRESEDTLVGRGGNDWLIASDRNPTDSLNGGRDTDMCNADPPDIVARCEVRRYR